MKKESIYLVLAFFILCAHSLYANKSVRLASPNGKIKFSLALDKNSPVYSVTFNKQTLIQDSPLTLTFDNGAFGENVKINKPVFSTKEETYELIVGKAKHIHSLSKEVIIPLEETVQPFRKINLVVRAFDDGIAFRYEFPKQKGWDSYIMYDEGTTFNLQSNPNVTTLFLPNYQSSHEGKYTVTDYADMDNKRLMDMPALFSFPNHVYMAITEAAVRDYAGMYLWKENGALLGKLSPKLGQERIKVEASLPHQSPWRVLMISDQIGSLIASNILTNLNEPCKIEDTSWIKPGKTTFTWWNGNVVPDTTFLGGNNFPTNKYYIDFVARNGLDYHSIYASLPHQSPWRVLMISDQIGSLIASNILTNLNEPCKIEDTSWIKPGKTTFTWWNGNVVPDTTFLGGNNFPTNKYYIDFVARNGLDYHSIYGNAEQAWYDEDGAGFGSPGPKADILKVVPSLNMQEICDYAKSQGVRIHLWTNWKPLYAKIDEAFAQFEKWGIAGMMIDFMDRDDQEMIRIQEEFLAKAAKHHLFVQFHGACKPSGLNRTYPNEFTREGTLNYEHCKWDKDTDADHDIHMPFTRLLAGATDYHLGGFRSLPRDKFKNQERNPYVMSTRCHMLAMYVVLESYLGMICDTPEAYEGQPGFEFLKAVPTTWDQTVVPNASVNEYVTIARKKGEDWFVGTINNSQARSIDVDLKFLDKDKKYKITIYKDAEDTNIDSNKLVKEVEEITYRDKITLPLASDGGSVFHIQPI